MTTIRPLRNWVAVKRIAMPVEKVGSIIIPEESREIPCEGLVVAVGPGEYNRFGVLLPNQAKVGDEIVFGKYAGIDIKIDGVEYVIMKDQEIMAVLPATVPEPRLRKVG